MAEVKAQLNGLRLAPRKVRSVANLLKGKDVDFALDQLEFLVKRPASPLMKLLKSAISNAENNFHLVKSNLYIKEFRVDEGVKLRRFKPKGFGRAAMIQKKTSKVQLVLGERVEGLKHKHEDHNHEVADKKEKTKEVKARGEKKPEVKKELGQKKEGVAKRFFQRKAI